MLLPISLNGNTVQVVSLPATTLAMSSVEFSFTTANATVVSTFTGQTQTQRWPGADQWSGTMTLPQLTQIQADEWISALLQMQGMANACQIGDPAKTSPRGTVLGTPTVDTTIPVVAGGIVLYTAGWTPSQINLLLPGDYIQVGYRLHRVLDAVNSDDSGKAAINIWPSLREVPAPDPITTSNPVGLFRLATNKGTWSADASKLSRLSFQIQEYR